MKQFIWFIFFLAAAAGIAYGSRYYPGTAQFIVASHQISMSIYVFAILFLILIVLFSVIWRMYRATMGLPSRWRDSRAKKREYRSIAAVQTATIALHEGRWAHAHNAAKVAAKLPQSAGLAALIGAASAHAQAKPAEALAWLAQLDGNDVFSDAKYLQQAEMALKTNDSSLALTALDKASATVRKHSLRFRDLQIQAHAQSGHWHEVLQLAKDKKWGVAQGIKDQWFIQATLGLVKDEAVSATYLRGIYKDMSQGVRAHDEVLSAYAQAMITRGEKAEARRVLEEAQRDNWRPDLLKAYVAAADENSVTAQLKMIEVWENQRNTEGKKDAQLLCAAGLLCLKAQLWGRAKANFQNSLNITPSIQAHFGLAQTYRAVGDASNAQLEEAKAAALAVGV
ncbi:heme biosynthesis HemY N-terminal domain-containing protein [Hydromonas duriensis]|uniref:HemY protein n=1 Tax=Hydromonas duriensis TaxID=1527608 RepID=A0A4R6Y6K9_9BURK|nr:heme biosynthesis HemY N-terminal domain-containing protein [Hydromonas duriensis]TDR31146.1 HemY protein [Hydromonas duriensis]